MRDDTCVMCGCWVPDGRMVCWSCEQSENVKKSMDQDVLIEQSIRSFLSWLVLHYAVFDRYGLEKSIGEILADYELREE